MKKFGAIVISALLCIGAAVMLTACAKTMSEKDIAEFKAQVKESTEHAMIINDFMGYMFGVDPDTDSKIIGETSQFNNTVHLLKVNNYLEYADHIQIVENERNEIVKVYEEYKEIVPEEIKSLYDNYIFVTDLAIDPQNPDDELAAFVDAYAEAAEKAEEIYGICNF